MTLGDPRRRPARAAHDARAGRTRAPPRRAPDDDDAIVEALRWADGARRCRSLVLGGGSNVVVADARLRRPGRAHRDARAALRGRRRGDVTLTAAAGEPWDDVVADSRRARSGRARVPVGHPRPGRRDADPERRRLRPGGRARRSASVRVARARERARARAARRRVRVRLPRQRVQARARALRRARR